MKKIFLLITLFFIFTIQAQKITKVTPPSVSTYLDYSAYTWINEKKEYSIKTLNFKPYSNNVELTTKTKDLEEISNEKFTFSITDNDVMILKNTSTKITLKVLIEKNPVKLMNTGTKEIFIGKSMKNPNIPSPSNPIKENE